MSILHKHCCRSRKNSGQRTVACSALVLPFILRYITGKNDGAAQAPLRGAFKIWRIEMSGQVWYDIRKQKQRKGAALDEPDKR